MKPATRLLFAAIALLQSCSVFAQSSALAVSERPAIAVQGDAEIQVDPDYAVLRIAVQHEGIGLLAVRNDNQAAVARLLADARTRGVPASDLASTPSMVFPGRWQCAACSNDEKGTGHTARSSITLTLRKMDLLGDIVERLYDDPHLQLEDVEYRTSQLREHRDRARAAAMRAAREKAQALVGELGQSIGKAITIEERSPQGDGFWSWSQWGYSCCGYYSSRGGSRGDMSQNVVMSDPDGGSAASVGTLAPGRIAVRAGVSVSFELL